MSQGDHSSGIDDYGYYHYYAHNGNSVNEEIKPSQPTFDTKLGIGNKKEFYSIGRQNRCGLILGLIILSLLLLMSILIGVLIYQSYSQPRKV